MTNRTATLRTERLNWFSARRRRSDLLAEVIGREAVFTTAEGVDMIGTITGTDRLDQHLVVTFEGGTWARLDNIVILLTPACTGDDDLCGAPAGQTCEPGCPSLAV